MPSIISNRTRIILAHKAGATPAALAAKYLVSLQVMRQALKAWGQLPEIEPPKPQQETAQMHVAKRKTPQRQATGPKDPERAAQIFALDDRGLSASRIAASLGLTRNIVLGVLYRAGRCNRGEVGKHASVTKARVEARKAAEANPIPPAALREPEAPAPKRKPALQGRGGNIHDRAVRRQAQLENAAKSDYLQPIIERPGANPGALFEDRTGCKWPFDDRSPWPRRPGMRADYLYCDAPRMIVADPRTGQASLKPYCKHHHKAAHSQMGLRAISIPPSVLS